VATRGQEAVEAFDRENFDLVSLDYILPGRLNGMDVYNHIRRKDTQVPVIFLSGNIAFLESMKDLKANDARTDHLAKPCENIVFADTVNEWLYHLFA
jgi:DNA-binding response OmpR family regulator